MKDATPAVVTQPSRPTAPYIKRFDSIDAIATVLLLGATIAALYLGRDILIPLAVAILLAFILTPAVEFLRQRRFGNGGSTAVVVVTALFLMLGLGWLLTGQLVQLAQQIPGYEHNLRAKVRDVGEAMRGGDLLVRWSGLVERLGEEVDRSAGAEPPATTTTAVPPPAPVVVASSGSSSASLELAGYVLHGLVTAGMVVIFLFFVIVYRADLRDRFIRLAGVGDVPRTTAMMNEAAQRISRFLLLTLLVNLVFGLTFGIALFLIGLPNAPLWGAMATVLRFIPFVGAPASSLGPIALAMAVDPGWMGPLLVLAVFLVIELTVAHVVEPLVYGGGTGVSPLALIVASLFWATLWGPIGLLLATPLLVCLVVLGRHVPQLETLHILFGNQPPLTAELTIYHRLLARDRDGAAEQLEAAAEAQGLERVCDTVVLALLALLDADDRRGVLGPQAKPEILTALTELVDQVQADEDESEDKAQKKGEEKDEAEPEAPSAPVRVACLGARTMTDDAAAAILVLLLRRAGIGARQLPRFRVRGAEPGPADEAAAVRTIVLVAVGADTARSTKRQLSLVARRHGEARMLLVLLDSAASDVGEAASFGPVKPTGVVTSFSRAVAAITGLERPDEPAPVAAPVAAGDDREQAADEPLERPSLVGERTAEALSVAAVEGTSSAAAR